MKKLLLIVQVFIFLAFNFFLLMAGYQAASSPSDSMQRLSYSEPVYDQIEEFDPSLARLSSIEELSLYCDSLYLVNSPQSITTNIDELYPEIATAVIRKRFFHGYSLYGLNSNYMAMLLAQVSMPGLSAIVVPNDILKYPYAACSQQSIVLMELLQSKGYRTRSVGFNSDITGHFTFETFYNDSWHYNDPNKEPDVAVLKAYNNPSIAYLNQHPDVLLKAYHQYPKDYVMTVFNNYSYGAENAFPAAKAIFFQKTAKFLSYTMWMFFLLAFVLVRRKYNKLKAMPARIERRGFALHQSTVADSAYYAA